MNDLSTDFDGDEERERQLVDLRVNGKSVGEICQMFNVTVADVNRALDRAAQEALTAAASSDDPRRAGSDGCARRSRFCRRRRAGTTGRLGS